jgi:hypothetical protein
MGCAYVVDVGLRFIFCGYTPGDISSDSTSTPQLVK